MGKLQVEINSLYTSCGASGTLACQAATLIWRTVPLLLLLMGTIGNVLSLIILSRRRLRKYSSTVYLQFLAVADLLALWTYGMEKALFFICDIDIQTVSRFMCKFLNWLFNTSASFSLWLLVLLTIERVVYTRKPIAARVNMTRKLASITSIITLIITAILQLHWMIGFDLMTVNDSLNINDSRKSVECRAVSRSYNTIVETLVIPASIALCVVLPFLVLLVGNITIALTVWQQHKKVIPAFLRPTVNWNVASIKTTKMLFLVCGFFTISMIPYTIFIYIYQSENWTDAEKENIKLVFALVSVLLMSNFTFNFLLYSVGGSLFKKELLIVTNSIRDSFGKFCARSNESTGTESNVQGPQIPSRLQASS